MMDRGRRGREIGVKFDFWGLGIEGMKVNKGWIGVI